MTDNVEQLGMHARNGTMMSLEATLQDVIGSIGRKGALENGKKLIVIALDDTKDCFSVSWFQCGMKMSECVALCEVAKAKFLEEMNY